MTHWICRLGCHHVSILQQHYPWVHDPSSGLMFDVADRTRQVILQPESRDAYAQAEVEVAAGRMIDQGIQDFGTVQENPGAIRCCCGRTVELVTDWEGTACPCGREYGSTGQVFRANWREFWQETGELSDDPSDDRY